MRISVTVKPRAKEENIQILSDTDYVVSVKPPAIDGKANVAVVKLLAKHFNISSANVKILQGFNSRKKVVDIILNSS